MAWEHSVFGGHFRPVNLGGTVFPSSLAGVFLPANVLPAHLLHCSPGDSEIASAVSPVADNAGGMSPVSFTNPRGLTLPFNGSREQSEASGLSSALMTPSSTSKKVKFLCSYGGKILPRPSDGALRYVGGHTRIISLHKDASLQQVMSKMEEVFGGPAVLKYQLPGEDLDALVSVSFPEDLESMIEEYDKLMEISPDGSTKLRIFLFPPSEFDISAVKFASDFVSYEQNYVELVNSGNSKEASVINRKESAGSDELSENSNDAASISTSIPTLSSSTESPDASTNPSLSIPVISQSPAFIDHTFVPSQWYPYVPVVPVPPFPSSLLQSGKTSKFEDSEAIAESPPKVEASPIDGDTMNLLELHYPLKEYPIEMAKASDVGLHEAAGMKEPRILGFDSQAGNYFPVDQTVEGLCMSFEDEYVKPQENLTPEDSIFLGEFMTRTHDGAGSEECIYLGKNTCTNAIHHMEGTDEELIKLELQAIAEDVASSVLRQSSPDDDPLSRSNYGKTADEVDLDQQCSSYLSHQKDEEFGGPRDEPHLDFHALNGISHLQIIKNSDIEEMEELGSGTFGTVYHGKWKGSDVAIKRINNVCFSGKKSEQEQMRVDFWNEARKLAVLHHPNVVAFYGVVLDSPGGSVATVTEFMVNGSLRRSLQRSHKTLDRRKRLIVAADVACGMEYLHGRNIVHFDLKSDNLLVNLRDPQRPICKVGDLGLSKVKRKTLISGGVRGTLPWMAPELLNGSSSLVSEKVDVFSFAIVMWELLTGQEPYADLHYGTIIGGIVNDTLRPPIPDSCDPDWRSLMEQCWSSEPSDRPSFAQISYDLRAMAGPPAPK